MIFTILALVAIGLGLAIRLSSACWNDQMSRSINRLNRSLAKGKSTIVRFEGFERLPAPVARYLRWALKEGQPRIRSVRIIQQGEFRSRIPDEKWSPFEAREYFSAEPPGFIWDARIRMAPFMKVSVRDEYIDGSGSMQARIAYLMRVIDESGRAELDAAALQRYLAEAVWFPTALLPHEGLTWSAIDDERALATLTDSGTTVSLEFRFKDTGEITGIYTPGRYREVSGKYELTPWVGNFRNYKEIEGMQVPVESDVEWQLPDRIIPYWKGMIIRAEYDFMQ